MTQLGNPIVNIIIFALFVVVTLTIVIKVTANQAKGAVKDAVGKVERKLDQ